MKYLYWDFVLEETWVYSYPHDPLDEKTAWQIFENKNSIYIGDL